MILNFPDNASSLVLSFKFLVTRGSQARNGNITLQP